MYNGTFYYKYIPYPHFLQAGFKPSFVLLMLYLLVIPVKNKVIFIERGWLGI